MTGRLAIWFCVLITIVSAAEGLNACCAANASILVYSNSNYKCNDDNEELNLLCADDDISWLDRNAPNVSFVINETTKNLVTGDEEFDPSRYCLNVLVDENDEYHEIALVCTEGNEEAEEDTPNVFLILIFGVLEIINIVFLLVIIVIYLALPELRDLQGKCILHFLINYVVLYVIADTLHRHDSLSCVVKAYSFYFFSFCAFCWLCVSSFNIWRASIFKNLENSRTYFLYIVYGYALPMIMLILMLLVQYIPGNHLKPNFDNENCWFQDYISRWWYYYSPIAILLLASTFFLGDSSRHLRKIHHSRINIHRIKALRARSWLYSKLYLVVGLTWVFEILHNDLFSSFQLLIFITDILNCLQGFFIFVILIATRNKVLKIIAKEKPCGMNCFPNSWITAVDTESEEENRNRYHNAANMEFIEIPLKTMNGNV